MLPMSSTENLNLVSVTSTTPPRSSRRSSITFQLSLDEASSAHPFMLITFAQVLSSAQCRFSARNLLATTPFRNTLGRPPASNGVHAPYDAPTLPARAP